jgi:hypothetical protein
MGYKVDKDEEQINELYPEGSLERNVVNYSRTPHEQDEVPAMLMTTFKLLMGITLIMAIFALVGFLSH